MALAIAAECEQRVDLHPEIQVWLYTEDRWPPQTLVQLYQWMQEDHLPTIFWRNGIPHSLNLFIRWTTEPGRLIFFPTYASDPTAITLDSIIGMCWFDEIEMPRAAVHFWIRKKYWWGRRGLLAAKKILPLIFAELPELQILTCRVNSDNRLALKFMKQVGVRVIGSIPNWYNHQGTLHGATFGYIPREDVETL